jgi:hypothetical protein
MVSDRRAKVIQLTASKPAYLVEFLQILLGTSFITKHQKQLTLIF